MTRRGGMLLLVGVVAMWLLLWVPVLKVWAEDLWNDPNYGHGLPLAAILLGIGILRARRSAGGDGSQVGNAWVWWLVAGCALGLGGFLAANDSLLRYSTVLTAIAGVMALCDERARRAWRGPLLAFVLLVPWPYVIYFSATARLQRWSTTAAAGFLRLSGVPLAREGNLLHFQGYDLEVIDACSGLRSLLTMTALAGVIAVAAGLGRWRTVTLLVLAIPLALLTNLLRLVLTGYAAQLGGPETAESVFHLGGGLLSFGLGALVLGWWAFGTGRERSA